MLQVTPKYQEYVSKTISFYQKWFLLQPSHFQEYNVVDGQMRQIIQPSTLTMPELCVQP